MSLAHVIKHVVDLLWELGGIGAAADLGMEGFDEEWASECPALVRVDCAPREGESSSRSGLR